MNPLFQKCDEIIDDFFTVTRKCATCANSHPTQAYPQLACMFRNEFVSPNDQCVRWEKNTVLGPYKYASAAHQQDG